MPPKKGKKSGKKKGGKKKGKKSAASTKEENAVTEEVVVDKEELLKDELSKVANEVLLIKQEIEGVKRECDFLQDEAQKIRVESHEYMSYMEKKSDKKKRCLITLSDYNQQEIRDLQQQQEKMIAAYEGEKAKLRAIISDKEIATAKVFQEMDDLNEVKRMKDEHLTRISDLEREVQTVRNRNSEQLRQIKQRMLQEKQKFEEDAEGKVQELAKEAYREAVSCLVSHTNNIKLENRALRKELLDMIQQTRNLQLHRVKLEAQHTELLREQQFARDLRDVRDTQNRRIYKALGGGALGANALLYTESELKPDFSNNASSKLLPREM